MDEVTTVNQVFTIVACIKLLSVYEDVCESLDLDILQSCIDNVEASFEQDQVLIFTAIRDFVSALRSAF